MMIPESMPDGNGKAIWHVSFQVSQVRLTMEKSFILMILAGSELWYSKAKKNSMKRSV
jgi:hypothetical protein